MVGDTLADRAESVEFAPVSFFDVASRDDETALDGLWLRSALGGSLRAGTAALLAALDAVNAGSADNVLVVASDDRLGYPRSDHESTFGDAAAAVVVSKGSAAVEVLAQVSINAEITDVWRRASDNFVRTWEDRFVITQGYDATTKVAIKEVLDRAKLKPADISKAVVYGPDSRNHLALVRGAGFEPESQVQDSLIGSVGNTGAAHALLMLVAALEDCQPGQKILLASYGQGADAFVVSEASAAVTGTAGIHGQAKLLDADGKTGFGELDRQVARVRHNMDDIAAVGPGAAGTAAA